MKSSILWAGVGTLVAFSYACSDDEDTASGPVTSSTAQQQASSTTSTTGQGAGGQGQGGGEGGAGGAACLTCNDYYGQCGPGMMMGTGGGPTCDELEGEMCAPAQTLWETLKTCLCEEAVCAVECLNFCTGGGMGIGCGMCVGEAIDAGGQCEGAFTACDMDM